MLSILLNKRSVFKSLLLSFSILTLVLSGCSLPWRNSQEPTSAPLVTEKQADSNLQIEPEVINMDVNPTLVESTPIPGSQLGIKEPITFTFNQPMDHVSVEAAITGNPEISGGFTWQDDMTVSFTPDRAYEPDTNLEITLAVTAKASNGKNLLRPVSVNYHILPGLTVTNSIPAVDSEEVDPTTQIVVAFNQPVVSLGQENPPSAFSIQPSSEGKGEWINTSTYVFYPSLSLDGGTTYTIMLNTNLTSAGSAPLESEILTTWQFRTAKPKVIEVSPVDSMLALDGPVVIDFNIRMDKSSTEKAFALKGPKGAKIEGTFTWNESQSQLSFTPDQLLKRNTSYTLTLSRNAAAQGGMKLGKSYTQEYLTYPYFSAFVNINADFKSYYANYGNLQILTSTPVDKTTLINAIEISPEISNLSVYPAYETQGVAISGYFKPATNYQVRLSTSIKDIWGQALPEALTFNITTPPADASFTLGSIPYGYGYGFAFTPPGNSMMFGQATNISYVNTSIARIDMDEFHWYINPDNYDGRRSYSPANQQYDTNYFELTPNKNEVVSIPLKYNNQDLTPGFYYVSLEAPEVQGQYTGGSNGFILAVSNYNTVLKISKEQAFVWVSRIEDQTPLVNTQVEVILANGRVIASGVTDENGFFQKDVSGIDYLYDNVYAIVGSLENPETFSMATNAWGSTFLNFDLGLDVNFGIEPVFVYTYTDRPIYRPGQEVYYKSIIRTRSNSIYSRPEYETLTVEVHASGGYDSGAVIYQAEVQLSNYGSLAGTFTIPEESSPGSCYMVIKNKEHILDTYYFEVANYRKPEIELEVNLMPDEALIGEDIQAKIQADYYFGVPASDLEVTWHLYAQENYFNLPGYHVGDLDTRWMQPAYIFDSYSKYGEMVAYGSAKTNADGLLEVTITAEELNFYDKPGFTELTLEASITDQSGFVVSQRSNSLLHPDQFYIGVKPEQYFSRENEITNYNIKTVDWHGEVVANKQLEAIFSTITWEIVGYEGVFNTPRYNAVEEVISTASPITSENGETRLSFTPPKPGTYQLTLTAGKALSKVLIWVGGESVAAWPQLVNNKLELTADISDYIPGQTASVFIPNPFPEAAKALVTLERGKVMFYDLVQVSGSGISYQIDLSENEIPNVYFGVILLGKNESGNPDYRQGMINLNVSPASKELDLSLTIVPTLTKPGEEVQVMLEIKDSSGNPVQGEFSLAMIDKAILALKDQIELPIMDAFFGIQSISVMTGQSITAYATQSSLAPTPIGGGGGGDMAPPPVREDFPDTAFWKGQVVTDEDGKATFTITLPDNLTTWHVLARGITNETLVGEAVAEVVTQKELMIIPTTPRFLVAGDHINLQAAVHNITNVDLEVAVSLQHTGFQLDNATRQTQAVTVAANSNVTVNWWGVVESVETVDLVFSASAGNLRDAAKPQWGNLAVKRYSTPIRYTTSGTLAEAGTTLEVVSFPTSYPIQGGSLDVALTPSLASTILDSLKIIKAHKETDNISRMAIILANFETERTFAAIGLEAPGATDDHESQIQYQVYKIIANQNYDGGWNWHESDDRWTESDPYITAYILYGLERMAEAGFQVSEYVLQSAKDFVKLNIALPKDNTDSRQLNSLCFMIFTLKGEVDNQERILNKLYDLRSQINPSAKAQLALTLAQIDPTDSRIKTLLSDLEGSAVLSAAGAHWESQDFSWHYPGTAAYTTANVLLVLAELDPASNLLVPAVTYLVNMRQGSRLWGSISDSSWSLIALDQALQGTGDLAADFSFSAALNGRSIAEGTAAGLGSLVPVSVSIPIKTLEENSANELVIAREAGNGRLYYRSDLVIYRSADSAPAVNKGLSLERRYFLEEACLGGCESVNEVSYKPGSLPPTVFVQLTLTVPTEMYHLHLEDFIPAGSEILNPNLGTSQGGEEAYEITFDENEYGWWVWLFFAEPQVYDDHILWTADYLPAGTYTLSYKFIPFQEGDYQVLPAHAYLYFFPEVEGSSKGDLFKIIKQ